MYPFFITPFKQIKQFQDTQDQDTMLPTLDFNEYSDIYTLTLTRDGKEVIYKFNTIALAEADSFPYEPDPNFTYYIWARYEGKDTMMYVSKDESYFLKNRLKEIREELAYYRESKRQIREYIAKKSNN